MSIRPTALISIATLGGSAIGLPIYLVQKQSTRTDLVQQAFPAVIPATSTTEFGDSDSEGDENRSKGVCTTKEISSELIEFLRTQNKDQKNYVGVSCNDTNVKDAYIPLTEGWTGLLPSSILVEKFISAKEEKFEMTTKTHRIVSNQKSRTEAVFSEEGLKSKISGNWDFIDSTQQLKAIEVSVTITGEEFSGNSIYLFLPKAESK